MNTSSFAKQAAAVFKKVINVNTVDGLEHRQIIRFNERHFFIPEYDELGVMRRFDAVEQHKKESFFMEKLTCEERVVVLNALEFDELKEFIESMCDKNFVALFDELDTRQRTKIFYMVEDIYRDRLITYMSENDLIKIIESMEWSERVWIFITLPKEEQKKLFGNILPSERYYMIDEEIKQSLFKWIPTVQEKVEVFESLDLSARRAILKFLSRDEKIELFKNIDWEIAQNHIREMDVEMIKTLFKRLSLEQFLELFAKGNHGSSFRFFFRIIKETHGTNMLIKIYRNVDWHVRRKIFDTKHEIALFLTKLSVQECEEALHKMPSNVAINVAGYFSNELREELKNALLAKFDSEFIKEHFGL